MLPTPIVRAATQAPKLHPLLYLYPAKKAWPPDFERLTDKHKFRLERKYRRRAKLKYARPQWNKAVKLAQYTSILGILVYGLFGMKWDEQNDSFPGFRKWYKATLDSIVNTGDPPPPSRGRDFPQR